MSSKHSSPEAHLFICTNRKEKGECCAERGGSRLRDVMKELSKDPARGWGKRVRVNASGCLGRCEDGIAAVLYPKGQWFTNLGPEDSEVLLKALADVLDR